MLDYLLVALGIFTSALAQIMLKKSSQFAFFKEFDFFLFFILGGLFYVVSFGLYAYVLKIFDLSKISPIMTIGVMLIVVATGALFFKETITLKQSLGILLGLASIVLVLK
jgi:multidrug transporter EmrE-like cation transporter